MDAARQASFREFVATRQQALPRSAYVLCGTGTRVLVALDGGTAPYAVHLSGARYAAAALTPTS